jgi:hypothetical protein
MVREVSIAASVLLSIAIAVPSGPSTLAVARGAEPATRSSSTERVEASPLRFEPNVGQLPTDISFAARGRGYDIAIGRSGAVSLARADSASVRMRFVGARTSACAGDERLAGVSNYLLGRDPSGWRTGIPGFGRVRAGGVYLGIDVVFYGSRGALEYDLVLAPGADPRAIDVEIEGASSVELSDDGSMLVHSHAGTLRHAPPVVYQESASGRRRVAGRYVARGPQRIGFEVGDYDRSLPLVVDPVITYSTLLYGESYEYGTDVAVDATGHAYITGYTQSATFPTSGTSVQPFHRGPSDAFVTKFAPDGKTLVYSTFVGGSSNEIGFGIAADALGNAYVTGMTLSGDFPLLNAPQPTRGGGTDAFVMKLDPSGSAILFSTLFGGGGSDYGESIAADAAGVAYLGGTSEADLPTTATAFQPTRPDGDATNIPFVAVLDTTKSGAGALRYATYLGGAHAVGGFTSDSAVTGIAPGPGGLVYVAGNTLQVDFPTTPNAVQPSPAGEQVNKDGFFAVLDTGRPGSAGLQYGTRLGGSGRDTLEGLAVDGTGMAYVAGTADSLDFPTTAEAYQPAAASEWRSDGFVAKIDPTRSGPAGLVYSTYLGGTDTDEIMDVGVDAAGRAYVTGNTASNDFPTHDSLNATPRLTTYLDGIVAVVASGGDALVSSSHFGGRELSRGLALAVDPAGDAYVLAIPGPGFPTTPGTFQASPGNRGASAMAVVKITVPGGACDLAAPQDVAAVATTLLGGRAGGLVDYALPSASGAGCGNSFVTCDPQPGAFMEVGTTRVICWATTPAGITSEASFDIQVSLPADLCAKRSDGGSIISVVSDPASSLYGYWAFGDTGGQYGPPTRVENIPGRRFVVEGSLSDERHFRAKYNYGTQRWKVVVWDEDDEYPSVYRAHGSVCSEAND